MGFFSSLHFLSLAGGAVALAAPLLILAYLQKNPLRRRTVSSLLLLKLLPKRPSLKRRVQLPIRFFVELLMLLLMALAATTPVLFDTSHRVAILLDSSLSMRALAPGLSGSNITRFQLARAAVEKWVGDQSALNTYTLYISAPKLSRVTDTNVTAGAVVSALSPLSATLAPDSMSAALEEILQAGSFDRVLVVSDRPSDRAANTIGDGNTTEIESLQVGTPVSNLYIANLRIENSAADASQSELAVSVGFSGMQPVDSEVKVFRRDGSQEQLVSSRPIRAQPNKILELNFPVPRKGSDVFYHISVSASGDAATTDAIVDDNDGWVTERTQAGKPMLVVSESGSTFGLEAIRSIRVLGSTPVEYAKLSDEERARFSVIIFQGAAPRIAPHVSSLFLLPPSDNTIFPIKKQVETPNISSWQSEHPLASYLKVPLLKPAAALIFEVPPWTQPIINVEQGPILLAGESRGVRFVACGLQILPFEGSNTPSATVLMLNIVNWLVGGEEFGTSLVTGATMRLEADAEWSVHFPNGSEEKFPIPQKGEAPTLTLPEKGIYTLIRSAAPGKNAKREILAVNPFHLEESSTFSVSPYSIPETSTDLSSAEIPQRPLWPYVLYIVLTIFAVDLLFQLFAIYDRMRGRVSTVA